MEPKEKRSRIGGWLGPQEGLGGSRRTQEGSYRPPAARSLMAIDGWEEGKVPFPLYRVKNSHLPMLRPTRQAWGGHHWKKARPGSPAWGPFSMGTGLMLRRAGAVPMTLKARLRSGGRNGEVRWMDGLGMPAEPAPP